MSPLFFKATPTPEIYTLSLHDALPISPDPPFCMPAFLRRNRRKRASQFPHRTNCCAIMRGKDNWRSEPLRSEEHTSELQSQSNLVCRLLLEKKKYNISKLHTTNIKHRL